MVSTIQEGGCIIPQRNNMESILQQLPNQKLKDRAEKMFKRLLTILHGQGNESPQKSNKDAVNLVKRFIDATDIDLRTGPEFVDIVHRCILLLHEFNNTIVAENNSYPYTEDLKMLLSKYVRLEYDLTRNEENLNFNQQYLANKEMNAIMTSSKNNKVLRILIHISYSVDKDMKKCCSRVLKLITEYFIIRYGIPLDDVFIESLLRNLLNAIGILEAVEKCDDIMFAPTDNIINIMKELEDSEVQKEKDDCKTNEVFVAEKEKPTEEERNEVPDEELSIILPNQSWIYENVNDGEEDDDDAVVMCFGLKDQHQENRSTVKLETSRSGNNAGCVAQTLNTTSPQKTVNAVPGTPKSKALIFNRSNFGGTPVRRVHPINDNDDLFTFEDSTPPVKTSPVERKPAQPSVQETSVKESKSSVDVIDCDDIADDLLCLSKKTDKTPKQQSTENKPNQTNTILIEEPISEKNNKPVKVKEQNTTLEVGPFSKVEIKKEYDSKLDISPRKPKQNEKNAPTQKILMTVDLISDNEDDEVISLIPTNEVEQTVAEPPLVDLSNTKDAYDNKDTSTPLVKIEPLNEETIENVLEFPEECIEQIAENESTPCEIDTKETSEERSNSPMIDDDHLFKITDNAAKKTQPKTNSGEDELSTNMLNININANSDNESETKENTDVGKLDHVNLQECSSPMEENHDSNDIETQSGQKDTSESTATSSETVESESVQNRYETPDKNVDNQSDLENDNETKELTEINNVTTNESTLETEAIATAEEPANLIITSRELTEETNKESTLERLANEATEEGSSKPEDSQSNEINNALSSKSALENETFTEEKGSLSEDNAFLNINPYESFINTQQNKTKPTLRDHKKQTNLHSVIDKLPSQTDWPSSTSFFVNDKVTQGQEVTEEDYVMDTEDFKQLNKPPKTKIPMENDEENVATNLKVPPSESKIEKHHKTVTDDSADVLSYIINHNLSHQQGESHLVNLWQKMAPGCSEPSDIPETNTTETDAVCKTYSRTPVQSHSGEDSSDHLVIDEGFTEENESVNKSLKKTVKPRKRNTVEKKPRSKKTKETAKEKMMETLELFENTKELTNKPKPLLKPKPKRIRRQSAKSKPPELETVTMSEFSNADNMPVLENQVLNLCGPQSLHDVPEEYIPEQLTSHDTHRKAKKSESKKHKHYDLDSSARSSYSNLTPNKLENEIEYVEVLDMSKKKEDTSAKTSNSKRFEIENLITFKNTSNSIQPVRILDHVIESTENIGKTNSINVKKMKKNLNQKLQDHPVENNEKNPKKRQKSNYTRVDDNSYKKTQHVKTYGRHESKRIEKTILPITETLCESASVSTKPNVLKVDTYSGIQKDQKVNEINKKTEIVNTIDEAIEEPESDIIYEKTTDVLEPEFAEVQSPLSGNCMVEEEVFKNETQDVETNTDYEKETTAINVNPQLSTCGTNFLITPEDNNTEPQTSKEDIVVNTAVQQGFQQQSSEYTIKFNEVDANSMLGDPELQMLLVNPQSIMLKPKKQTNEDHTDKLGYQFANTAMIPTTDNSTDNAGIPNDQKTDSTDSNEKFTSCDTFANTAMIPTTDNSTDNADIPNDQKTDSTDSNEKFTSCDTALAELGPPDGADDNIIHQLNIAVIGILSNGQSQEIQKSQHQETGTSWTGSSEPFDSSFQETLPSNAGGYFCDILPPVKTEPLSPEVEGFNMQIDVSTECDTNQTVYLNQISIDNNAKSSSESELNESHALKFDPSENNPHKMIDASTECETNQSGYLSNQTHIENDITRTKSNIESEPHADLNESNSQNNLQHTETTEIDTSRKNTRIPPTKHVPPRVPKVLDDSKTTTMIAKKERKVVTVKNSADEFNTVEKNTISNLLIFPEKPIESTNAVCNDEPVPVQEIIISTHKPEKQDTIFLPSLPDTSNVASEFPKTTIKNILANNKMCNVGFPSDQTSQSYSKDKKQKESEKQSKMQADPVKPKTTEMNDSASRKFDEFKRKCEMDKKAEDERKKRDEVERKKRAEDERKKRDEEVRKKRDEEVRKKRDEDVRKKRDEEVRKRKHEEEKQRLEEIDKKHRKDARIKDQSRNAPKRKSNDPAPTTFHKKPYDGYSTSSSATASSSRSQTGSSVRNFTDTLQERVKNPRLTNLNQTDIKDRHVNMQKHSTPIFGGYYTKQNQRNYSANKNDRLPPMHQPAETTHSAHSNIGYFTGTPAERAEAPKTYRQYREQKAKLEQQQKQVEAEALKKAQANVIVEHVNAIPKSKTTEQNTPNKPTSSLFWNHLNIDHPDAKDIHFFGPPSAPCGIPIVTQVSKDQVNVKWQSPTHDGGSVVTNFLLEYTYPGCDTWNSVPGDCSDLNLTVQGLQFDVGYIFRVSAKNRSGYSNPGNSSQIFYLRRY